MMYGPVLLQKEGIASDVHTYTNCDQFINKREDLCMSISDHKPDLIFLTEIITKAQKLPISTALLSIHGFTLFLNFDASFANLGSSGKRRICVFVFKMYLNLLKKENCCKSPACYGSFTIPPPQPLIEQQTAFVKNVHKREWQPPNGLCIQEPINRHIPREAANSEGILKRS